MNRSKKRMNNWIYTIIYLHIYSFLCTFQEFPTREYFFLWKKNWLWAAPLTSNKNIFCYLIPLSHWEFFFHKNKRFKKFKNWRYIKNNRFYLLYKVFNSSKVNHCNSLSYIYPDFCLQTYASWGPMEGGKQHLLNCLNCKILNGECCGNIVCLTLNKFAIML